MQKLTGISSGQNNKSCGIIHSGSNKIGFAVLRFFYDFIRNLQETGKSLLLFELPFCREDPGKSLGVAMQPLGAVAGAGGPITVSSPPSLAREGRGKGARVARDRFGLDLGVKVAGGGVCSGRRRRPPLERLVRRGGRLCGRGGTSVSCGRCQGRWGRTWSSA
jgi:hypothetical protein